MHADIKTQWIAALRSGEYSQGQGYLNSDGKFCCLGVLCDLAAKAGVVETEFPNGKDSEDPSKWAVRYGHTGAIAVFPHEVMDWAGIPSYTGELPASVTGFNDFGFQTACSLTELNDYMGYSFNQIANVIEEQF